MVEIRGNAESSGFPSDERRTESTMESIIFHHFPIFLDGPQSVSLCVVKRVMGI